jgi:hypothetical protein
MKNSSRERDFLWKPLLLLGVTGLVSSPAYARKFDFKSEYIATHFGGTFGNSILADNAYGPSSGTGTSVDKQVQSTASGQIGFVLSLKKFNIRLEAEYLMPRAMEGVTGTDAAGNQLFSLNSRVTALIPSATLELVAHETPTSKILFGVGYGIASVSLENAYTMTAAGKTALGVTSDFTEKASGTAPMWQGYLGYEVLFTDTTTALLHIGYRQLQVTSLQSTEAATAIVGAESPGNDLINSNGSKRSFDLGGPFIGCQFRFYIGI